MRLREGLNLSVGPGSEMERRRNGDGVEMGSSKRPPVRRKDEQLASLSGSRALVGARIRGELSRGL